MSSSKFLPSFLPTQGAQNPQKLENYAQLYATYTNIIQSHADAMRPNMQDMLKAYHQVATEFAAEQESAKNKMGDKYILADLNEYASRCGIKPKSFDE